MRGQDPPFGVGGVGRVVPRPAGRQVIGNGGTYLSIELGSEPLVITRDGPEPSGCSPTSVGTGP
ncbi:hypothetical protein DKT69_00310 [Micromonospora sicca]|uniref:Uncharacterized protein n=1 Tax=Micromonospora sicca TaxID=2202420 RepID=A0A317DTR4_9ACTN|nr:hypothetical protein DKT69_00310 [Micromonospora sp. 4G51]